MPTLTLFDDGTHRNFLLEDFGRGQMVQANQHLIVHGDAGMILDPGGHKVFNLALSEATARMGRAKLQLLLLSHQDPDIVAAINSWLMATAATAWVSSLWLRFVPHFGLDSSLLPRLRPIPDEGLRLDLGGSTLMVLPAHFLHSPGNFQVYDPRAKILYSGDLGASLGSEAQVVSELEAHLRHMEGFHTRYMTSGKALRAWAAMARTLDIETIAPQHGAILQGRDLVWQFIDWCASLECGVDLMPETYALPRAP